MTNNPNNSKNQKLRGLKRKYEAILLRGGKCEKCGYNKNLAALEFHHRNPKEKDFAIDVRHFSNTKLETLSIELNKCDLLCSNCHREHHNPDLYLSDVVLFLKDCKKSSFTNPMGAVCPVCGNHFPKMSGKIYCSDECRWKDKGYPSIDEINSKYLELKSWEKVAQSFGITRRITQGIRKRNS